MGMSMIGFSRWLVRIMRGERHVQGARMQESSGHNHAAAASHRCPKAVAAAAQGDDWRLALDSLLHTIRNGHQTAPDLVVLFPSSAYADEYPELVREAWQRSGAKCLIGTSSRGVIAGSVCYETEPSISMLALWLPGATLTPVRLHQSMLDALDDPEVQDGVYGPPSAETRGWVFFADPYRMDAQDAVRRLRTRYPGVPVVGALASTGKQDRRAWVFFDDQVYDEGGVALAIGGPYDLQVVVSQGGDPIGEPWTITGVERNLITSISNRSALDVMRETIEALPKDVGLDIERNLMLGFPMDEYQHQFHRGDFVVRGLLGIDEERGALIVGSLPRSGQTVQFQLRDAASSALDLQQVLVDARALVGDGDVVAGMICTCKGRGTAMFGRPDHDARTVRAAFRDLPFAGMFSFGEIGPVRGVPALNGFAMSFGLIVHRGDE